MPTQTQQPPNLTSLGIQSPTSIIHNPSYDTLFNHETDPRLGGYERGQLTELDTVNVLTGRFTGRSPKDKYVVDDTTTHDTVWWEADGSDNKPISQAVWQELKTIATTQLSQQSLYVVDGYCGANPATRLSVRLVTEVAWQAHFFKNMFIRPSDAELAQFKPDWTILNACKATAPHHASWGLRSENFVAFNIQERMTLIGGTWYGGEMKKGIFSIMNYFLPLAGIGSFHCSANQGMDGSTALFFGLSGTGKTTLSTDPKRLLIGDDEHGWDQDGIFNFEGGCYAKTIDLSLEKEPDIFHAIKRNALLENVDVSEKGTVRFESSRYTENTRVSYPIDHITRIVTPHSKGTHPQHIVFLTCDAYGVLPPVSKLTNDQAMYQYLSGYTAKVAGTELGVSEPTATFSACFGRAFLMVHPTQYAAILGEKMTQHGSHAYLVNTGWIGGGVGVGSRISLKATRAIIDAILSGDIESAPWESFQVFGFQIPTALPNVPADILNPARAWADQAAYRQTLEKLARQFQDNFKKYATTPIGIQVQQAGPTIGG
ncbi:phosphoenolpyruvate carboxykinase (ATP) [bacterium]|nr:phosphoenolpyruvate carboxykinase (ATP) [bacterium]